MDPVHPKDLVPRAPYDRDAVTDRAMQIIREDSSLSRTQARQRAERELGFAAHRKSSKGPWNASPGALKRRGAILFGSSIFFAFIVFITFANGDPDTFATSRPDIEMYIAFGAAAVLASVGLVMLIVAVMWAIRETKGTG